MPRTLNGRLLREILTAARFGVVGLTATGVHITVVWLLIQNTRLPVLLANFCAFLTAFGVSFSGNYLWTFGSPGNTRIAMGRFFLISITALFLNSAVLLILVTYLRIEHTIAVVSAAAIFPLFTYLASRLWAFNFPPPSASNRGDPGNASNARGPAPEKPFIRNSLWQGESMSALKFLRVLGHRIENWQTDSPFWPVTLGILAFLVVAGPNCLIPTNIAWLGRSDPIAHYLGWTFFRNTPWGFPLGTNPAYGLDLSNSIVYSDSNPLLAIFFKAFSPILPDHFQYFGLWLLICFILQAWFGWKLLGLYTKNPLIRLLGAGLIVFSPTLIRRIHVHFTLCAHFLILASLYFALNPYLKRRTLCWAITLSVALLVHAYLFLMVALLWMASLADSLLKSRLPFSKGLLEIGIISALLPLVAWQAGYFGVGKGLDAEGFGYYKMNLLSIFYSNGWSYVLPNLISKPGDADGSIFLGFGLILLLISVIPIAYKRRSQLAAAGGQHPFLILAILSMTALAASSNIGLGPYSFTIPLPDPLLKILGVFRASGRFAWPFYYGFVLLLIVLFIREKSSRTVSLVFGLLLAVQIFDTSRGWRSIRWLLTSEPPMVFTKPLKGPFWDSAATHYSFVRMLPPQNEGENYAAAAYYAAQHRLSTDAINLARVSSSAFQRREEEAAREMKEGDYRPDTLYIVKKSVMDSPDFRINPESDLLANIDGLNVLAPGWKKCTPCLDAFSAPAP